MNFKLLKSGVVVVLGMVVASLVHAATPLRLQDTGNKHNLSTSGQAAGNTIYAVDNTDPRRTQICIFCHTPHNADSTQAPLWSHADQDASVTFQMASSTHVNPKSGKSWIDSQPTGISKKCLSCHDGTVAIGAVLNGSPIQVTGAKGGSGDTLTGSRSAGGGLGPDGFGNMDTGYIGTDLRGGHVISFNYKTVVDSFDASHTNYNGWDGANPISDSDKKSMFDRQGKMQCHSCHDPHTDWCDDGIHIVGNDPLWRKACGGVGVGNRSVCDVCHRSAPGPGFINYSF